VRRHLPITAAEIAYRVDLPLPAWQEKLGRAIFRAQKGGPGLLAYEFDASLPDQPIGIGSSVVVGDAEWFERGLRPLHAAVATREVWPVFRVGTHCSTILTRLSEEGMQFPKEHPFMQTRRKIGFDDIWGICAMNPDGRGVAFAIPVSGDQAGSIETYRSEWRRVGVHIAAGYRLRNRLKRMIEPATAEAVLAPDGRMQSASDEAKPTEAREALKRAVRAIERARLEKTKPEEAMSLWRGLVNGTWSLIEQVETDGKRYYLAARNDPEVQRERRLSIREAQVAGYAAQGHSNKFIAYELGLSISTVATHLQNALEKLRLRSRTELIWTYTATVSTP